MSEDFTPTTESQVRQNMLERRQDHQAIMLRLDGIEANQKIMAKKIDPMYEIFVSVNGFNKIAVWVFKFLVGLGALIGAFWTIAHFIVKNGGGSNQ